MFRRADFVKALKPGDTFLYVFEDGTCSVGERTDERLWDPCSGRYDYVRDCTPNIFNCENFYTLDEKSYDSPEDPELAVRLSILGLVESDIPKLICAD